VAAPQKFSWESTPAKAPAPQKFSWDTKAATPKAPPAPKPTSWWDTAERALKLGVGDVVEGAGSLIGTVTNPLNTALNMTGIPKALTGKRLGTDLGGSARRASGLPQPVTPKEKLGTAINSAGTAALTGAGMAGGAARGGSALAKFFAEAPVTQTVGGMGAGAGSETARQKGLPAWAQVAAGLAGGLAGGSAAVGGKMAARAAAPAGKALWGEARRLAAPATFDADAGAAAALHRRVRGIRSAEADKAIANTSVHARTLSRLTPTGVADFMDVVEAKPGAPKLETLPPELQSAARDYKAITNHYRNQISASGKGVGGKAAANWRDDWAPHMWKPTREDAMSPGVSGKEGNNRSLRARTIEYYTDGLQAGKTPLFSNPVDTLNAYVENMSKRIGSHDILHGDGGMKDLFGAKAFVPGAKTIPPGWVKLEGNTATRRALGMKNKDGAITGVMPERTFYAPKGAALIYNRYVSTGLDNSAVFRGARATSNALKQANLGLSGFHAMTIAVESIASDVARSVQSLSRGNPLKAASALIKAPAAPITSALRGTKMAKQMVGDSRVAVATGVESKVNQMFARAGGKIGMDKVYGTRASSSFFNSFKRGTFKADLQSAFAKTYQGSLGENAKGVLDLVGNTVQSLAAPLFESYIPAVKRGAFAARMEDFINRFPKATDAALEAESRRALDSMDNRFGEMLKDNMFWSKTAQQMSELIYLSPSWKIGTARELGGGITELPESARGLLKGEGVTGKTAYSIALPATMAMISGVSTYMMTGEKPTGMDYVAPRTGGTQASGKSTVPERLAIPSNFKDELQTIMGGGPIAELEGGINTLPNAIYELVNNLDWRKDPIRNPNADPLTQAGQVGGYAAKRAEPYSVSNFADNGVQGSKISPTARMMGFRASPRFVSDPEGNTRDEKARNDRAWKTKEGHEKKDAARRAPTPPAAKGFSWDQPDAAPTPSKGFSWDKQPAKSDAGPRVKPGASNAGALRPEMKPILDMLSSIPGFNRITSENDSYHPAGDVHGQGKAIDFSVKGSSTKAAADLRRRLSDAGIKAKVYDEYNSPSRRATAGHIHVQLA